MNMDAFEDFVGWQGTRSGRFSVRSAYHTEWRHQFNGVTCRSLIQGISVNNPTWKMLWKLKVPAKVLAPVFGWLQVQVHSEKWRLGDDPERVNPV